ncbi:MAG: metal-dependent hydrolase [Phototrophicales bacterium]|nr:MAG: metal-dependent hydrolase [Phototrophicales bacterium]RMG73851.1 MAG: metal-dependent hydrolase [Chloroflexota bacterium]
MSVAFTWLGHSAFQLEVDGHIALIDPFLTGNPLAAAKAEDLNPEVILVSHAHGDHVGDTVEIAKRSGATVVCNFEMGNWFMKQGVENVFQGNPGGTYHGSFLSAKWLIAHHSSSFPDGTYGGQPNGFLIQVRGKKLYFAGDTALFLDMKLLAEENIDVAFLPIGDTFTMGPEDSLRAIDFIRPHHVVPMHYNTFPPIVQNTAQWAKDVHAQTLATPIVLDPGGKHILE